VSPDLLGAALVVGGYLAGSIPFGVVLSRLFVGVDVRTVGSGNIGATNVARAGGRKLGVAVLLLDAAKAVLPILLARALLAGTPHGEGWTLAVALAAFVGHLFPVWLGFRGGKGVATGLGIFVVLSPWSAVAGLVTYGLAYAATRISSVGSLLGTAACAVTTFVVYGWSPPAWTGLALAALIFLRHRENLRRLIRGEERRMRV
jgi:glycerol-3-phosphate acyltransferase PlsY